MCPCGNGVMVTKCSTNPHHSYQHSHGQNSTRPRENPLGTTPVMHRPISKWFISTREYLMPLERDFLFLCSQIISWPQSTFRRVNACVPLSRPTVNLESGQRTNLNFVQIRLRKKKPSKEKTFSANIPFAGQPMTGGLNSVHIMYYINRYKTATRYSGNEKVKCSKKIPNRLGLWSQFNTKEPSGRWPQPVPWQISTFLFHPRAVPSCSIKAWITWTQLLLYAEYCNTALR